MSMLKFGVVSLYTHEAFLRTNLPRTSPMWVNRLFTDVDRNDPNVAKKTKGVSTVNSLNQRFNSYSSQLVSNLQPLLFRFPHRLHGVLVEELFSMRLGKCVVAISAILNKLNLIVGQILQPATQYVRWFRREKE